MSLAMTRAEREAFLADLHVAVLAIADPVGGAPLAAPIWYAYEPGGNVRIFTGEDSQKAAALRAAGRATCTVQSEEPPYKYVTVSGPVAISSGVPDDERRAMAIRYLGPKLGEGYLAATSAEGSVTVELHPETWRTTDYAKGQ